MFQLCQEQDIYLSNILSCEIYKK